MTDRGALLLVFHAQQAACESPQAASPLLGEEHAPEPMESTAEVRAAVASAATTETAETPAEVDGDAKADGRGALTFSAQTLTPPTAPATPIQTAAGAGCDTRKGAADVCSWGDSAFTRYGASGHVPALPAKGPPKNFRPASQPAPYKAPPAALLAAKGTPAAGLRVNVLPPPGFLAAKSPPAHPSLASSPPAHPSLESDTKYVRATPKAPPPLPATHLVRVDPEEVVFWLGRRARECIYV